MHNEINYPYMPEGRSFKFVDLDDEFMAAAKQVCDEESGCAWWPGGSVVVKDGEIIGRSGIKGVLTIPCARLEQGCPTGTGYHLCTERCDAPNPPDNHSEFNAIVAAQEAGHDTRGADLYLFGHWWCCENCWNKMLSAGIRQVYLLENADRIFTREPRVKLMERFTQSGFRGSPERNEIRWQL